MKIAFISSSRDPSLPQIDSDGGAVTIRHYASELGRLGHIVDIYTGRVAKSAHNNKYSNTKSKAQHENTITLGHNVRVIRNALKYNAAHKHPPQLRPSEKLRVVHAQNFAHSFNPHDLHTYELVCLFHIITAYGFLSQKKILPNKVVLFPMLLSGEYKKFSTVSDAYIKIEQKVLSSVSHICSPSQSEKGALIALGIKKNKIAIVPRGFDETIFYHRARRSYPKGKKVKIACVGAIRPQKQQDKLITIAKLLIRRGYLPKITIIGENKNFYDKTYEGYYLKIKKRIAQFGLKKFFHFTGNLESKKIANTLRKSDIAIFPSVGESFGKAAMEAIATGIPTILRKSISAYKEFAPRGVYALAVDDPPENFVRIIENLLLDHSLYLRISREGGILAKNFSWEITSKKLESFLKSIKKTRAF
ncbi:MAG: glycosyltransferase family 4 protein [Patescibacteria group bacterium]